MHLPEWIYSVLPFVYLLTGLAVAATMESAIAVASGFLLVIAGLLIWKMRVEYRRQAPATRNARVSARRR